MTQMQLDMIGFVLLAALLCSAVAGMAATSAYRRVRLLEQRARELDFSDKLLAEMTSMLSEHSRRLHALEAEHPKGPFRG